jgi:hypothetical protein
VFNSLPVTVVVEHYDATKLGPVKDLPAHRWNHIQRACLAEFFKLFERGYDNDDARSAVDITVYE